MKHGVPSVTVSNILSEKYWLTGRQLSSQGFAEDNGEMKQIANVVKLLKCLFEPVMSHASHLRRERIFVIYF